MTAGSRWKKAVRAILPAWMLKRIERRFFRVRWTGDYAQWRDAEADCEGYATKRILRAVTTAARAVRDGQAVYERDGVAFYEPPGDWPALAILRDTAAAQDGKLTVLDFGGSLGSSYFHARRGLPVRELHWRVVEQVPFVEIGRSEFQNSQLEFYSSIGEACDGGMPDVVLLASVLPYLPSPAEALAQLAAIGAPWLLVERTGFTTGVGARLTVQHVPRSIYRASYPCWFLSRSEFLRSVGSRYRVAADFREDIETPLGLEFRSLHLRLTQ